MKHTKQNTKNNVKKTHNTHKRKQQKTTTKTKTN